MPESADRASVDGAIDELLGRRSARSLGIKVTGTIGNIVPAAKHPGLLDRVRAVIEELVNHRLYIDAEILARVLRGIGEQ
ncbi:MAG: hypothetical protein HYX75_17775 [Acidobacteria bacterium]|nr:hypothetical protein [Acidobacteriota bacterium]